MKVMKLERAVKSRQIWLIEEETRFNQITCRPRIEELNELRAISGPICEKYYQSNQFVPFFRKCAYKSLNLLKTLIVSSLKLMNSTLIFLVLSSDNTSLIDDIEL